jgi:hypothetical protein
MGCHGAMWIAEVQMGSGLSRRATGVLLNSSCSCSVLLCVLCSELVLVLVLVLECLVAIGCSSKKVGLDNSTYHITQPVSSWSPCADLPAFAAGGLAFARAFLSVNRASLTHRRTNTHATPPHQTKKAQAGIRTLGQKLKVGLRSFQCWRTSPSAR